MIIPPFLISSFKILLRHSSPGLNVKDNNVFPTNLCATHPSNLRDLWDVYKFRDLVDPFALQKYWLPSGNWRTFVHQLGINRVSELNFPKYGKGNLQIYNSNPDLQRSLIVRKRRGAKKGKGIKQENRQTVQENYQTKRMTWWKGRM